MDANLATVKCAKPQSKDERRHTRMIRRETLQGWRNVVNKFDYHPTQQRERQLIDSHLEALTVIDVLREEIADLRPLVQKVENMEIELRRRSYGPPMAD